MEGHIKTYQRYAEACEDLAVTSSNPASRKMYADMAQTWRRLAAETEATESLLSLLDSIEAKAA